MNASLVPISLAVSLNCHLARPHCPPFIIHAGQTKGGLSGRGVQWRSNTALLVESCVFLLLCLIWDQSCNWTCLLPKPRTEESIHRTERQLGTSKLETNLKQRVSVDLYQLTSNLDLKGFILWGKLSFNRNIFLLDTLSLYTLCFANINHTWC